MLPQTIEKGRLKEVETIIFDEVCKFGIIFQRVFPDTSDSY